MKKMISAILLAVAIQASGAAPAEKKPENSSVDRPVPQEYYRRFVAADSFNGQNFYWLDSTNGHLWEFDRSLSEWEDLGKGKGMTPGPKGTYILWSDKRDGVYVLHTDSGKGWWYDGSRWQIIDPADSATEENNTIY